MSVTIPRAEIRAIAAKYDADFRLDVDPTAAHIRLVADEYRREADSLRGTLGEDYMAAAKLLAEANDLDALVDRIEQEAA